jgi:hypothetical protein
MRSNQCTAIVFPARGSLPLAPGGHVSLRLDIILKEERIMERLISVRRRQAGFLVAFASFALMLATPVGAQVKPGDFITPENGSKVKDLVSPGVCYKVQHGVTLSLLRVRL